jgi:hypothetical protein
LLAVHVQPEQFVGQRQSAPHVRCWHALQPVVSTVPGMQSREPAQALHRPQPQEASHWRDCVPQKPQGRVSICPGVH